MLHNADFRKLSIACGILLSGLAGSVFAQVPGDKGVVVESAGWNLIGDLRIPPSADPVPGVLMLNKAAGDRMAYLELADELYKRGIGSLRVDLRGHGESVNLGRFVPGEHRRDPLIWDSEADVVAARKFLMSQPGIRANRIGVVGASYSGEEMAEAGRLTTYADAYVALSPGSFTDESIAGIDSSGVPWLFVVSNNERYLKEIEAEVRRTSSSVEMIVVPGAAHATELLAEHPGLAERIAVWLKTSLE